MSRTGEAHLSFYILRTFIPTLLGFALLWIVLNEALISGNLFASPTITSSNLERGQSYIQRAWEFSPLIAATAVTLALQSRAAFESDGGAR